MEKNHNCYSCCYCWKFGTYCTYFNMNLKEYFAEKNDCPRYERMNGEDDE